MHAGVRLMTPIAEGDIATLRFGDRAAPPGGAEWGARFAAVRVTADGTLDLDHFDGRRFDLDRRRQHFAHAHPHGLPEDFRRLGGRQRDDLGEQHEGRLRFEIVVGDDVRVSTVAIAQGNLTISVGETPQVSQPSPFSRNGETVVVPRTSVGADDEPADLKIVQESVRLRDLVDGLNALGVSPRDLIAILQAIKAAGALQADIEVL